MYQSFKHCCQTILSYFLPTRRPLRVDRQGHAKQLAIVYGKHTTGSVNRWFQDWTDSLLALLDTRCRPTTDYPLGLLALLLLPSTSRLVSTLLNSTTWKKNTGPLHWTEAIYADTIL